MVSIRKWAVSWVRICYYKVNFPAYKREDGVATDATWTRLFRRSVLLATSTSMHDAYHTARGRSFDIAREELPLLVRISDTIVLSYCSGGYWLCNYTMPRWRRYTAFHGYDHAVISNDNMDAITSFWSRYEDCDVLFTLGYTCVVLVDADTAVIHWEHSIASWLLLEQGDLPRCDFPHGHREYAYGNRTSLVVSRERRHFGFMPPPQGPIQGGLLIMRNGTLARSLLQWQHRQRARFNGSSRLFNQDQGALNGWYYNFVHGHWDNLQFNNTMDEQVSIIRNCYGSRPFMCTPDFVKVLFGTNRSLSNAAGPAFEYDFKSAPDQLIQGLIAQNAWLLHTMAIKNEFEIPLERMRGSAEWIPTGRQLIMAIFESVDRLNPINLSGIASPAFVRAQRPWRCSEASLANLSLSAPAAVVSQFKSACCIRETRG